MWLAKRLGTRGLYPAALCLLSVFVLAVGGSASAAPLLFVPHSGKFPYHFVGSNGLASIVTLSGSVIETPKSDILVLVLSPTLFRMHVVTLGVTFQGEPCGNPTAVSGQILINLEGHLGLADPGDVPAILELVPGHFTFKCRVFGGFEVPVLVKGSIIGRVTAPALNTASTLLLVSFKQVGGEQEFTTFLVGNETLTNRFEEISINGQPFEKMGGANHATLHALPGEGTFLLVTP
jgi:hypothetical protein